MSKNRERSTIIASASPFNTTSASDKQQKALAKGMINLMPQIEQKQTDMFGSMINKLSDVVSAILFPDLPDYYPFKKKVEISRTNSLTGVLWDLTQVCAALIVCATYVVGLYTISLDSLTRLYYIDVVMTQLFLAEFVLGLYLKPSILYFDFFILIDILTIIPVYLSFGLGAKYTRLNFLKCLRILTLLKIFKNMKFIRNLSGVKRQIISLITTLVCLIFLAAGIIQLVENSGNQNLSNCKYINDATNWLPSCSSTSPMNPSNCDCDYYNCHASYRIGDEVGKPSEINCVVLTFYNSFYYIMVTVATIGYGDITPSTIAGKVVIIVFIVGSIILIPMRVNELQRLLSLRSIFRQPYHPAPSENHVIICGHVNNADKLDRFFEEFFHPDRTTSAGQEYHAVVLSPFEPNEELRALLQSPALDSKVTYVQGSALAAEDLKKVKAESASCVFFLCNIETSQAMASAEDAATVLRALSVSNFNPNLDCLVQVLRPEDRSILKDSDVDVILCLDEFKTALQARNAICPGFSTFIENIFHSMENVADDLKSNLAPWYQEYLNGAGMELYFVQLDPLFISCMKFSYKSISEAIFVEFKTIVIGLTNTDKSSLVFNPTIKDLEEFNNPVTFFDEYNVALIFADDQHCADEISRCLSDAIFVSKILDKMEDVEENFPCRYKKPDSRSNRVTSFKPAKLMRSQSNKRDFFTMGGIRGGGINAAFLYETAKENREKVMSKEMVIEDVHIAQDDEISPTYIGFRSPKTSFTSISSSSTNRPTSPARNKVDSNILPQKSNDQPTNVMSGPSLSIVEQPIESTRYTYIEGSRAVSVKSNDANSNQAEEHSIMEPGQIGCVSMEILDAALLRKHIIVVGGSSNILMFISELRRPEVSGMIYHPVLVVSEKEPLAWDTIKTKFNDIYFIRGDLKKKDLMQRINIEHAFSLTFLATRDVSLSHDDEGMDASNLFTYLKVEHQIPNEVFTSVELNCSSNMAVLNAQVVRRIKRRLLELEEENINSTNSPKENTRKSMRRGSAISLGDGKFAQRNTQLTLADLQKNSSNTTSVYQIPSKNSESAIEEKKSLNEKQLWEVMNSHHVFPVFACARAFQPSSFESLLVQSFYVKLTPVICEKFICGQLGQTVVQVGLPPLWGGRVFLDIYRIFCHHQVLCFGIYRHPQVALGAIVPYVFLSPPVDVVVHEKDKLYLFGTTSAISKALTFTNNRM